nr:hypothetical protein [Tanacetum cinerariifolium]
MVINSPCLTDKKELAIPGQTATSKELSNPLMAGSLPKTTLPTKLLKVNAARLKLTTVRVYAAKKIFEGLARIGYEEPSDKLTFYKAFFSPQWKFLIHTILQFLSAKTTSWNEFSSSMAFAIICLATNQKFNFSRYILLSLVKNIEDGVPFFMFPRFVQLIINHQLGDMTHHKDIFDTPSLTKKIFANMKRVGTGFFGEVTLLFDNMLVQAPEEMGILQANPQSIPIPLNHQLPNPRRNTNQREIPSGKDSLKLKELMDFCTNLSNKVLDLESEVINIKSTYKVKIKKLKSRVARLEEENSVLKELKGVYSTVDSDEPVMKKEVSSKQERKIADIDADVEINLEKVQAEAYNLDLDHQEKVFSMLDVNDEEPADVEEVVEVITTAKLITKVVTTAERKGVIIQDPKETTTTVTVQPKIQAKDKEKAILIEEPKPLKRQVQIDLNEESKRLTYAGMKYQALKRKPLTEAQARRNMIVYLKNMAGYKMNYFNEMSYNEIIPLFEKYYDYNQAFLNEVNEGIKVSEKEIFLLVEKMYPLTRFALEQMVNDVRLEVDYESKMYLELLRLAKRQLNEGIHKSYQSQVTILRPVGYGPKVSEKEVRQEKEVEVESSKREDGDDDDVYADVTPLASKIPIFDYKIHTERNRPYFKIIRADGNHRLFMSFSTMTRNFDREDLESLWKIIRERFEKTEPKNYSDDYLLNTL